MQPQVKILVYMVLYGKGLKPVVVDISTVLITLFFFGGRGGG